MTLNKQEILNLVQRAKDGNTEAQNELAARLATGDGFDRNIKSAIYWYKEAANNGSPEAIYNLALMYLFGEGVTIDKGKAIELMIEAVDSGSPDASLVLGEAYETGNLGLNVDYMEAAKYYLEAIRLGSVKAIRNLGELLNSNKIAEKELAGILLHYEIPSMRRAKGEYTE